MRFTSPSRRAAGLLAVTTIGLSTAVLGVTGTASAEDGVTTVTESAAPVAPADQPTAPALETPAADSGSVVAAAAVAPGAPTLVYVDGGDTEADFQFTPGTNGDAQPTSWQYTVDGGTTWTTFTIHGTGTDDLTGTATGLTNLRTYDLSVRGVSSAGNGAASAPLSFQPYHPVSAPSSVTAAVGVTSVRISWTPAADTTGTVKYEGFVNVPGAQNSGGVVTCTTADATQTSCTVAVAAGQAYDFGVHGIDAGGNLGDGLFGENPTAVVPASAVPAALPTASGSLTSSDADGKVKVGDPITLSGDGYLPGSTVEVVLYSTPVSLGTVVVGADGRFSTSVTLPAGTANAKHHLVGAGVDANGNPRYLITEITVSGGTGLAYTGFTPLPYLGAGALALLAGGGLLVASRRRAS